MDRRIPRAQICCQIGSGAFRDVDEDQPSLLRVRVQDHFDDPLLIRGRNDHELSPRRFGIWAISLTLPSPVMPHLPRRRPVASTGHPLTRRRREGIGERLANRHWIQSLVAWYTDVAGRSIKKCGYVLRVYPYPHEETDDSTLRFASPMPVSSSDEFARYPDNRINRAANDMRDCVDDCLEHIDFIEQTTLVARVGLHVLARPRTGDGGLVRAH